MVDFGMELQEAIEAPRFSIGHFPSSFYPHTARPGVLRVESRIDERVRDELARRGHKVETRQPWSEGFVLAVQADCARGVLCGGADPRGQLAVVMPAQAIGW
jgi:gamma-glutamyltranspeptidase / glutathione hydrolase